VGKLGKLNFLKTFVFELRSTGKVKYTKGRNKCIKKDKNQKSRHRTEIENTKRERKGRNKENFT
jgi:hypothetical protein